MLDSWGQWPRWLVVSSSAVMEVAYGCRELGVGEGWARKGCGV